MNHGETVIFLSSVEDLVPGSFKRGTYQTVIPVLRDRMLTPKKDVLRRQEDLTRLRLQQTRSQPYIASGSQFYNTYDCHFNNPTAAALQPAANLRNSIVDFNENIRDVLKRFDAERSRQATHRPKRCRIPSSCFTGIIS